ncbi:hypothetical protein BVRB_1g013210 isoform C [Beta vulgaris subsp. vulgaris]|nr:hypothetical protein BVRB_1g013210 isoform C [Beta vulgaris subsp. vulgaris]
MITTSHDANLLKLHEVSPLALKPNPYLAQELFKQWLLLPETNCLIDAHVVASVATFTFPCSNQEQLLPGQVLVQLQCYDYVVASRLFQHHLISADCSHGVRR